MFEDDEKNEYDLNETILIIIIIIFIQISYIISFK
jgi:hypothetical protein